MLAPLRLPGRAGSAGSFARIPWALFHCSLRPVAFVPVGAVWDRRLARRPLVAVTYWRCCSLPLASWCYDAIRHGGGKMPYDNPHQTPFGDLELLMEARGRISSRDTWVQGHFQKRGRYCLVASLSLTCGSRSFGMPNRMEMRLSRLVVMHMPSNAPFRIRHRSMPSRRRLIAFNDDLLTQHDDVIALLDRAIEHLASTALVCVAA